LFWLGTQVYVYPILVFMEKPSVWGALRFALAAAFANPFFTVVLMVIAGALTFVSIVLFIFLFFAWPAVMVLLGQHSLRLFLERAGVKPED
jgi:hypothetical protein